MRQVSIPRYRRVGLLAAALAAGLTQVTNAQAATPSALLDSSQPAVGHRVATRASGGLIATQVFLGAVAAWAVGFGAWSIVDNPEGSDRRVQGDAGYTPNANTAFAVGSFVGATLTTYLVGRADGSRASFAVTALGAAIASIPVALGRHSPYLPIVGLVLWAPLQGIGGTIGYQLTRREP